MRSVWKSKIFYPSTTSPQPYRQPARYYVPSGLLDRRISVYNGKKLESLIVRSYMVGKKLSAFVTTRYSGKMIHIKKKKRKK